MLWFLCAVILFYVISGYQPSRLLPVIVSIHYYPSIKNINTNLARLKRIDKFKCNKFVLLGILKILIIQYILKTRIQIDKSDNI